MKVKTSNGNEIICTSEEYKIISGATINEPIAQIKKCPICKSSKTQKRGFRPTENRGNIQKKQCLKCGHNFSEESDFTHRMRMPDFILIFILCNYIKGNTTRYISRECKKLHGYEISHVSISNYINRVIGGEE